MSIQKDINELINQGIINDATAEAIRQYYLEKKETAPNRLFLVFGILGATLIGIGILLILAHNWDNFSRLVKTILAFSPLVIGQGLVAYSLLRKSENATWLEASSIFLFFGVGTCIAMIGQIYNLPGDTASFILTWMLLCLPLVYLARSSVVSIFYLFGITNYACSINYWDYPTQENYWYFILLLGIIPHYYYLYKHRPASNAITLHHWGIPLSLLVSLGILSTQQNEVLVLTYFSVFGIFYLFGNQPYFNGYSLWRNGYKVLGILGSIFLLFILSYDEYWRALHQMLFRKMDILTIDWLSAIGITVIATLFLFQQIKKVHFKQNPFSFLFLTFAIIFTLGCFTENFLPIILINLLLLGLGIWFIQRGATQNQLGVLNFGLTILTLLIICRFYDWDISFIVRGILFVLIGLVFFYANYKLLQKQKSHAT